MMKKLVGMTVLAGTVAAGGLAFKRARVIKQVPTELRRPGLFAPIPINNQRMLKIARDRRGGASALVEGVEQRVVRLPGTSATLLTYDSPERPRPSGALIWIHGGGFVSGAAAPSNDFCSELARDLGLFVVNVDYRLAPEHPFPAALDDCFDALLWLHSNAASLGIDPERIVIAGASAGGGHAAAVAQRARDEGVPLAFQVLVYPMLDDRSAVRRDLSWVTWSPMSNRFGWKCYLGHPAGEDESRPYAVPARREDLQGLAPTWTVVGDLDLFHEEVVDYAARLRAAGVPTEIEVIPGMYHGADASAPEAPTMKAFRARVIEVIEQASRQNSPDSP